MSAKSEKATTAIKPFALSDFFTLGAASVSPDGTRLAYSVDVSGDDRRDALAAAIEEAGYKVAA